MSFGPAVMAPDGHSRAHLLQCSQKRCNPKSIGLSCATVKSVVTVPLFRRGPREGLRITSPMRLISPRPDSSSSGGCSTSPSSIECTRAE